MLLMGESLSRLPFPFAYSLFVSPPKLKETIAALEKLYGKPRPFPSRDPWELILRENAAYLVDDAAREAVFQSLKKRVGISPEAILGAPPARLVDAIREGGMRPSMRAAKLVEGAEIASEVGLVRLRKLAKEGGAEARKALKRFPGVGEPGADRLLLAAGSAAALAPDSNGLRVLVRLGFCAAAEERVAKAESDAVENRHPVRVTGRARVSGDWREQQGVRARRKDRGRSEELRGRLGGGAGSALGSRRRPGRLQDD